MTPQQRHRKEYQSRSVAAAAVFVVDFVVDVDGGGADQRRPFRIRVASRRPGQNQNQNIEKLKAKTIVSWVNGAFRGGGGGSFGKWMEGGARCSLSLASACTWGPGGVMWGKQDSWARARFGTLGSRRASCTVTRFGLPRGVNLVHNSSK